MFQTAAIAGLGLIGGSMAKAAAARHPGLTVLGYDLDGETCRLALEEGTIAAANDFGRLGEAELLLVALFPRQAMDFVRLHLGELRPGALVVDLCGVKGPVCEFLAPLCREAGLGYIGGHPMAGREVSGYRSALAGLFQGASMILVPTPASSEEHLLAVQAFFASLGFSHVEVTTAERHDRMIAFTSQLVHVVSNCYIKSPSAPEHHGYSAGSYRDLTRVAKLDPAMWSELFLWNREPLLRELDILTHSLAQVRDAIEAGDREKLHALLEEGSDRKKQIDAR